MRKSAYSKELNLNLDEMDTFFFHVKDTQDVRASTIELMRRLKLNRYRLFALTDNVHENVSILKTKYDFWNAFEGAIVSAEVGVLKPSEEIYQHLLGKFDLKPTETVFLDDLRRNVDGAKAVGMSAFQFFDATQAESNLIEIGFVLGF